jgi:arginase
MSAGQPRGGTELAPAAFRDAGLREVVTELGWGYEDAGDAVIPAVGSGAAEGTNLNLARMRNAIEVGRGNAAIYSLVRAATQEGRFALTLGGDHSIAAGSVSGVLSVRPDARILWVDAHADIHSPTTSISGNAHGMPLSFLLRLVDPRTVPGHAWLAESSPPLLPSRLVYVGLRDVEKPERKLIASLGIRAFTMTDIDRLGIGKVMEMALDTLLGGKGGEHPLHVSFDVDAVDPTIIPGTGTAVQGGLNYREAHYLCEACAETGLLGSMDVVEVNPLLEQGNKEGAGAGAGAGGSGGTTVPTAIGFIASALGKSIL